MDNVPNNRVIEGRSLHEAYSYIRLFVSKEIGKCSCGESGGDKLVRQVELGWQRRGKDEKYQNGRVDNIEIPVPTVFAAGEP